MLLRKRQKLEAGIHNSIWQEDFNVVSVEVDNLGYISAIISPTTLSDDEHNEIIVLLREVTGLHDWKWIIRAHGPEWMLIEYRSVGHKYLWGINEKLRV